MAEKEYIERDEILQKISKMIEYCKKDNKVNGLTALFQVGDAIIDCKSADVQEVRHGKWESTELMYENGCTRCSECKTEYYVSGLEEICGDTLPTFCPICGARMDGEENAKTNLRKP